MNFQLIKNLTLASTIVLSLVAEVPQQSAYATGGGCSAFVDRGSRGLGNTCIHVDGKGLVVNWVRGNFTKGNKLSNWYYVIEFRDKDDKLYQSFKQPINRRAAGEGRYRKSFTPTPYIAQRGSICAKLYASGSYIDAACADIDRE